MAIANPSLMTVYATTPKDICPVAYTDSWRDGEPGVPYYENGATSISVTYDDTNIVVGEDISCNGVLFDLTASLVYSLTAIVNCNVAGATFQWFEVVDTVETAISAATPCGTSFTTYYQPGTNTTIVLKVLAASGTSFTYPAQVTNSTVSILVTDGYTVA